MEFNTTQAFVKALEGVRDSEVLEQPVLGDVIEMIQMSYDNGTIDEAVRFMNEKYDYYVVKNMHQLFIQIDAVVYFLWQQKLLPLRNLIRKQSFSVRKLLPEEVDG